MRLATLSTWRGYPLWKCALCGFTATTRPRMLAHLTTGGLGHNIRREFEVPDAPADETTPATESTPDTEPDTTAEEESGDGTDGSDAD